MKPSLAFRILDANRNRAREGLRVAEEAARFGLGDRALLDRVRAARHRLGRLTRPWEALLLAARDSAGDPGADAPPSGAGDPVAAGLKRAQEALRALEDFAPSPAFRREAQRLRFAAYEIERELVPRLVRRARLGDARLYVLLSPGDPVRVAAEAARAGADVLQWRPEGLNDRAVWRIARRIARIARGASVLFLVNDRADIAAATADGVHLGARDLPIAEARRLLGPGAVVGATTHTLAEARHAARAGADYLSVGPMFSSPTKPGLAPRGFTYLRAARALGLPVFAIGGITPGNVARVRRAGADRIAVGSAVTAAARPGEIVRALRRRMDPRLHR